MEWADERFVKYFTRDTPDFQVLSFEAQGLIGLIMRKLDRAGVLDLGRQGARGVAIAINHPQRWDVIEPALLELLKDGVFVLVGNKLVMRNFLEAQHAFQSPRLRQEEWRARRRDIASAVEAGIVTPRDAESHGVTKSNADQRAETLTPADAYPDLQADAVAPPLAMPAIALSSQLPDSGTTETADVAYGGQNGGGGRQADGADGSKPATGKPRPSRAKRQASLLPSEAVELATYLLEAIRTHKPNVKDGSRAWAKDLDLAMRVDRRAPDAIRAVIDFAHRSRDTFWRPNLLSGAKVREHFDTLELQAARAPAPALSWGEVAAEMRRRGVP